MKEVRVIISKPIDLKTKNKNSPSSIVMTFQALKSNWPIKRLIYIRWSSCCSKWIIKLIKPTRAKKSSKWMQKCPRLKRSNLKKEWSTWRNSMTRWKWLLARIRRVLIRKSMISRWRFGSSKWLSGVWYSRCRQWVKKSQDLKSARKYLPLFQDCPLHALRIWIQVKKSDKLSNQRYQWPWKKLKAENMII